MANSNTQKKQLDLRLVPEFPPSSDNISALSENLTEANLLAIPDLHERVTSFGYFLRPRNEEKEMLGGICGRIFLGVCQIKYLWVSNDLRGYGFGQKLLACSEDWARNQNVGCAAVDTFSFQARGFYEKHGFLVEYEQQGYEDGHSRIFMKKSL